MTPRRFLLFASLLTVLALLTVLTGCGRTAPVAGHTPIGLLPSGQVRTLGTPVRWFSLERYRHRVMDALVELGSRQRLQEATVESLYTTLASMRPKHDAFAQTRLALRRMSGRRNAQGMGGVFEVSRQLAKDAPDHPDRLFLEGYLRWLIVRSGDRKDPSWAMARDGMVGMWSRLAREYPEWMGPGKIDAAWLQARIQAVSGGESP